MSITLAVGGTSVSLNKDLVWTDEFSWTPVVQTVDPSITGALIVQVGTLQAGREITLQPDNDSGTIDGGTLTQVQSWLQIADQTMVLTIRGLARNVMFRHKDRGIEVQKWIHYDDLQDDDQYFVVFRFMEV